MYNKQLKNQSEAAITAHRRRRGSLIANADIIDCFRIQGKTAPQG